MVITWGGLNDAEQQQLKPILSSTDNWILLTQPLGASNKTLAPLRDSPGRGGKQQTQGMVARREGQACLTFHDGSGVD